MTLRRTKILSTLGPATDDPETLLAMIQAGANVFRLNFSHGKAEEHRRRVEMVREIAGKANAHIALLGDLQGPKIRIARFKNGKIVLKPGARFTLNMTLDKEAGDENEVGVDYPAIFEDCEPGNILLLDDGRVEFKVVEKRYPKLICEVILGGALSNNKGINRQGGGLTAPALTEKDEADIKLAAEFQLDYVAVSFPRSDDDMHRARQLLREAGSDAALVAKIERAEVVNDLDQLDQVILASDAVMVARGDLGVEIGDAQLIGVQKHIIHRARQLNRVVITATQMMETMIQSPFPTRAEVFDVANAVLDGTDAVMLSAETATGAYPVQAVQAMARTCLGAEQHRVARVSHHRMDETFARVDEAIAMAAMYTANHLEGVAAILCLTESGATPLWMSRIRSGLPIFALSPNAPVLRKVALYRGVVPMYFDPTTVAFEQVNAAAVELLERSGHVKDGDYVIITRGDSLGIMGGTNTMKIFKVGQTSTAP
ncbi:MAG TPA: pyruvate kinase [Pseudomonadales bacterium]|nr:pyruvate kinase [Pseudomonadales bacterium]